MQTPARSNRKSSGIAQFFECFTEPADIDHPPPLPNMPGDNGALGESKKPVYTDKDMGDAAHNLNALAADLGYTFESAKVILERGAIDTPREPTGRATAKPRPDWKEVRQLGEGLPDFIEREFAPELAARAMHRGLLSRYRNLRSDFYGYQRNHELPPELKAIPTEKEWNDRRLAELGRPPRPARVRTDETRLYEAARYRVGKSL
jgi:hypothetical protein